MSVSLAASGMVSLNAAMATGVGTSYKVTGCCKFGLQVVLGSGAPATAVVLLEGTNDTNADDTKNHWVTLATWDVTTPQTSGDILFAVDKPCAKIRANCTTLSLGANKTVTATLSAV
ncbi:MAG: hypothetical protein ACHP7J_00025 [Terriglobales bacterium]